MTSSRPILAALFLVAACSSDPSSTQTATRGGTGGNAGIEGGGGGGAAKGGTGGAANGGTGGNGGTSTTTSRTALLSNNTSASTTFADVYTPGTQWNVSTGPISNGDAPSSTTPFIDMAHGVVSKVPIRSLLYPGATTKVFLEAQGWFCTNGHATIPTTANADQCGSHIDIGYDSNAKAHVLSTPRAICRTSTGKRSRIQSCIASEAPSRVSTMRS
jgi:hypothetical protein